MHPLLLFTLFFISGNLPTNLSSSVKRNLEYFYKSNDLDGTNHLNGDNGQDNTEQNKPNVQVKYKGNEQTVYIPLNSGSNSGFIKYYTSYKEQSHNYPSNVFVKSVYQSSMTPAYNNGNIVPKRNTNVNNKYKVAFVKNQNKPLISKNKNPYVYRTSFTLSEPLKTVQNIGKPYKKELGKTRKPFKQESNKGDDSKLVATYKTKENFNSEENSKGKNNLWDESDAKFFNDDTIDNVFDDLSNGKDKTNSEKNKKSKKINNNQSNKKIEDIKSISSQNKKKNDDSDSKENEMINKLKSEKSEIKFKENFQNVVRKPRTDKDNESLLKNRKIEDNGTNFIDKSKLSTLTEPTTTLTITPLQIPRNEIENVTKQYIPLHTTIEPYRGNSQDPHETARHNAKEDKYSGFITKLIEPLMNNLRNML